MTPFDQTVAHITGEPTIIYGLKFFPSLEPHVSNNQDSPGWGWHSGPEVSDCNLSVVADVVQKLGARCNVIMEIGVHRNQDRSMTNILMDMRPKGSTYLGVDIDDKSYLDDPVSGVHTVKCNSHDQRTVRNKLRTIGADKIDILMIDGWHSVNTCVNDWCYTDLLSDHGCVIVHDTNAHPGCVALYHAVDESLFDKQRFCVDQSDTGIATFWHRR
jgi:hypothetical protein